MKELDSILCCKVPKDAEKKVMDQLQKFNWCIDANDLAINKNLQKDSCNAFEIISLFIFRWL